MLAAKFGLGDLREGDESLMAELLDLMHQAEVDMTDCFRRLADIVPGAPVLDTLAPAFHDTDLRRTPRRTPCDVHA